MARANVAKIFRTGVAAWNAWRQTVRVTLDLRDISYPKSDLQGINLSRVNLRRANLSNADLSGANLTFAWLGNANLSGANLNGASLSGTEFDGANLSHAQLTNTHGDSLMDHASSIAFQRVTSFRDADLSNADLTKSYFREADFRGADLLSARLSVTTFVDARVDYTRFLRAEMQSTNLLGIDLRNAIELDHVAHRGPSAVDVRTLRNSFGRIPPNFLRGCGLTDPEVVMARLHDRDLTSDEIGALLYEIDQLRSRRPIQISPVFISYSHRDSAFVDPLQDELNASHIRFWRDVHHLVAGRLETQIDRAITLFDVVIIILSESSVSSDWVEWEATRARRLEHETDHDVLCPIALDNSWKMSNWSPALRTQIEKYNILDFSRWQDGTSFRAAYRRLVDGLGLFYRRP